MSKVLLSVGDKGTVTSVFQDEQSHIRGIWEFRDRHLVTMIGYVQAGAPEFEQIGLTQALDYHEWVLKKATAPRGSVSIAALVEADYRMRTAWMLSYVSGDHRLLKDAVTHHRGQSAYLFAEVNRAQDRTDTTGGGQPNPRNQQPKRALPWPAESPRKEARKEAGRPKGRGSAGAAAQLKSGTEGFLEHRTKAGTDRCKWYTKGKCNKGSSCAFEHSCNFPGCGQRHPRVDHHPTKPE